MGNAGGMCQGEIIMFRHRVHVKGVSGRTETAEFQGLICQSSLWMKSNAPDPRAW